MIKIIKGTIAYIPVMYPVLVFLVIDGLSLAFYSSEIPHLFPNDIDKDTLNKLAGLAVVCMGAGSTIGGYLCGIVADKKGSQIAGDKGLVSYFISCAIVLCVLIWPSTWLTFIAAFFWGYSLFYIESWMYTICSRYYEGKAEAYSVNKQLHSLFYLLSQIAIFFTNNQLPLKTLIIVMAILVFPAYLLKRQLPQISK